MEELKKAISELVSIHDSEVSALLSGEFAEIEPLRAKLRVARERKAIMIDRYREHVIEHKC